MRATFIYGPGDIRVEEVEQDTIQQPTDAVIEVKAACVCGSDLWGYRGENETREPSRMGHEYVGIVSEVGSEVTSVQPGDWVVGSFVASCGVCEICQAGDYSGCINREMMGGVGTQAEYARVPWADGTLVKLPAPPNDEQLRHLLAASDVLGTGWFGADAAVAAPGKSVAIIGDGAVGLSAVLAAKELGADRIIISSRHKDRQDLARKFGATDIVEERGDEFVSKIKDMTNGYGVHSAVEAVGTNQAMHQAIAATRRGGRVSFLGVSHGVELTGEQLFGALVHLHGGPAPVRRYLPELVERIYDGGFTPGDVFTQVLPLDQAAEGYKAMDERSAIKVMLTP